MGQGSHYQLPSPRNTHTHTFIRGLTVLRRKRFEKSATLHMVTKDKEGLQQRQNQTGAAKSSKRGFGWARSKKLSPAGQKPIAYEADPAAEEAARTAKRRPYNPAPELYKKAPSQSQDQMPSPSPSPSPSLLAGPIQVHPGPGTPAATAPAAAPAPVAAIDPLEAGLAD